MNQKKLYAMKLDLGDLEHVSGGGGGAVTRRQAYCPICLQPLSIYKLSARTDDGGTTSLFKCVTGSCENCKQGKIMNNQEVKWM